MSPGFSESMRKLHEPCGARLVADVAHALLRAVSRLISTPALLFDTVCESWARTVEKSLDAARRSACATPATTCPTLAHPVSSTSGGLRLFRHASRTPVNPMTRCEKIARQAKPPAPPSFASPCTASEVGQTISSAGPPESNFHTLAFT